MMNYMKLRTRSPFTYSFLFLDSERHLADQLFEKHKVPVKIKEEFGRDDLKYRIIFCKVKKKDKDRFVEALSEMENKMLLLGYNDYQEFCEAVNIILKGALETETPIY